MISIMSSERFSPLNKLTSTRFNHAFSMNEHVMKIKEDLDMKRLYESKFGKMNNSNSFAFSSSSFPSTSNSEGNQNTISRLLSRGEKRSMSEITNLLRFREFGVRNRSGESESSDSTIDWLCFYKCMIQEVFLRSQPLQQVQESSLATWCRHNVAMTFLGWLHLRDFDTTCPHYVTTLMWPTLCSVSAPRFLKPSLVYHSQIARLPNSRTQSPVAPLNTL
ncbi:hypothetical protein ACSBR2_037722 [Camellia fascicularis]